MINVEYELNLTYSNMHITNESLYDDAVCNSDDCFNSFD